VAGTGVQVLRYAGGGDAATQILTMGLAMGSGRSGQCHGPAEHSQEARGAVTHRARAGASPLWTLS
jgi:hypothetical protein